MRLRYWARLLAAFIVRFRVIIFAGIIFGLIAFATAMLVIPRFFTNSKEYIGITGRYHADELPNFILNMLGSGLTKVNEKGEIVSGLAEKWESNESGTEWTFQIKDGLYWHDNSKVDANTINYSFEDTKVEKLDSMTIKFSLSSPFSPFPSVVSKPAFKRGLLGTGEWKVANLRLAGSYVKELVLVNHNKEKKIFRFYPSEDSTKIAYQLGQIDKIFDISNPSPFDTWDNTIITEIIKKNRIVALFFNNESKIFKGPENKPLRQALSYAIDKENFNGPRALGPISPNSWAFNPLIKDYDYDIDHARKISKDYPKNFEINLATSAALLSVAEKVADYWKNLDIVTKIHVVSFLPEEYDVFLAVYDTPIDPDQYSIWHTTQKGTNISKYTNPRIDRLLEEGRVTINAEERKKIYLDFQRFLLEDAPAIFLYHPISYNIARK